MPDGLTNAMAIAAGGYHSLVLTSDGTVIGRGNDGYGQATVPAGLSKVVQVSAGWLHSLALKDDGTVIGWGSNTFGESSVPPGLSNVVAVAAGGYMRYHSLALKGDGTVVGWGDNTYGQTTPPGGLGTLVAVAAGDGWNAALTRDGTVVAWGDSAFGQTSVPVGLSDVIAISAEARQGFALRSDGTVVAWGSSDFGPMPYGLTNIVAIASGTSHSLAVKRDRTVVCWGYDIAGQASVPASLSNVVAVAGGQMFSLALQCDEFPAILRQPTSRTLFSGMPTVLSVTAFDPATLSFQWQFNGTNIESATSAWLSLTNLQTSEAGCYRVAVSDAQGTVVSSNAILTVVSSPPVVVAQPTDTLVPFGSDARFLVTAAGSWPLHYQWQHSGTNLAGATNADFHLDNVQPVHTGAYSVLLSNAYGMAASADALLTGVPALITIQPPDQTAVLGGAAVFTAAVEGNTPLRYQWEFNGRDLPGATNHSLTLTGVQYEQAGQYSVRVNTAYGIATGSANLTVTGVAAWGGNYSGQTDVPPDLTNVVAVAAGSDCSLALRADGTMVAWGVSYSDVTNVPPGLSNVTAIAVGAVHGLALQRDGTAIAWGLNYNGETTVPPGLRNVVAVAAGGSHSLVLRADGTVVAWGLNESGQTNVPPGLRNVVAVAAGSDRSLALRADGTVVAWGDNQYGQTNVPPFLNSVVAIAAGEDHNLALRADGTVVAWGADWVGQSSVPADLHEVTSIAAGYFQSLALRSDGTVVAWGKSHNGSEWIPATVPDGLSNVVAIAAGTGHAVALLGHGPPVFNASLMDRQVVQDVGTVVFHAPAVGGLPLNYQWQFDGTNVLGATNAWLRLTGVQADQAGRYSVTVGNAWGAASAQASLAVNPAQVAVVPETQATYPGGTVCFQAEVEGVRPVTYQWQFKGADIEGETNDTLVLENVRWGQQGPYSVNVSNRYGTAVSSEVVLQIVNVAAWGRFFVAETNVPTCLSNAVAIAAGGDHSLALRADGTVLAWGGNAYRQTNVPPGLSNVVAVAAGVIHSMALRADGTVVSWGHNGEGRADVPIGLNNVVAIAASSRSLALRMNGTVAGWGPLYFGPGSPPVSIPASLTNVVAVAAGGAHNLALRADGRVTGWGDNFYGQIQIPRSLSNAVAIAGGGDHSLALRTDGTVLTWGANYWGQTNMPPGLSNVVAIAGGGLHSMALRSDGTVVSWGYTDRTNVPPGLSNVVAIAAGTSHSLAIVGPALPLTLTMSGPDTTNSFFRQTGLMTQRIRVYNTTAFAFPATRVVVHGLLPGATVYNLSGRDADGLPYIQYNQSITPGASVELTIEYHVPSRAAPAVTLVSEVVEPDEPLTPTGTPQDSLRSLRMEDGSYLIDFQTLAGRTYYVQYSSDLASWGTAFPSVAGSGSTMQWVDNGPPKTDSHPSAQTNRFYRILLVP